MIKGTTVTLVNEVANGVDGFNNPIYEEIKTEVNDVLVAPSTSEEVLDATNLYGKKAIYTIAIPKGDTHIWENQKVIFFGKSWRVFGTAQEGIEENIPLRWNAKYMVERYE